MVSSLIAHIQEVLWNSEVMIPTHMKVAERSPACPWRDTLQDTWMLHICHDGFVNLSVVRLSHTRPGPPLTATLPRKSQYEMQRSFLAASPLWKPDPQMTFHFVTNTMFCSNSSSFRPSFSSQKEKQKDRKRISDCYFCMATECKVLWKYYLNVEVFFLFLVTYITTAGMWAFWH